jgi:hypothetical protein
VNTLEDGTRLDFIDDLIDEDEKNSIKMKLKM